MNWVKKFWPFILIFAVVLFVFLPVFKGQIPFPGDLLVNQNPYKTQGYLGYQPGGYPHKAQGPDVINEIYPWRYFSIAELKQFNVPFWNPYNFSGNPQMADFQTAVFYPLNFIYFLLPFNLSWTLLVMLQPLLAGFFMYLFLKKGIGLKDFASFIGGVSFAFCSYMTVWIEYTNIGSTFLWLPLALLFVKYYFNKPRVKFFLGIITILSAAILAGYIQGVFYIYVLCFLYYNFLVFSSNYAFKNHKKNFLFLISLLLPFIITAFQIIPTVSLFFQSTRGAYALPQIEKNLAPFFYWITAVIPDFFGNPATRNYWIDGTYIERVMYPGAAILFFAFFAVVSKIKILEKRFFLIIAALSLIIATNLPFVKYFYLLPIPLISTTIPTREFSVFIFSMIVLGAIGLDHFLNEKKYSFKIVFLFLGFFISVWSVILIFLKTSKDFSENLKITEHNLILPTILFLFLTLAFYIKGKYKKISIILITLIVVLDLFYFFNKITPFSPKELVYPNTPIISYIKNVAGINRFWGYGSAYIPPNFQSVDMTFSPEGNDPLHISRYGELLSSTFNGKLPVILPRPDANIAPGYGSLDLRTNFYRKRILDLLGVKYILNKQDLVNEFRNADLTTFPDNQYKLIYKTYPFQVYKNLNSLPRFFIVNNYVLAKNKGQALSFIYDPKINLRKTLILEKSPNINISINSNSQAKLISYSPGHVVISTDLSANSLLFLSDNYYPEWKVEIDGKESELLIADYTFRGVAVPEGNHTVEFVYKPNAFKLGLSVSLIGLIILFFSVIYVKNRKEKS